MPDENASFPKPNQRHPILLPDGSPHAGTVFLSAVVAHPRMEIGDYTYASAHHPPDDWATSLAPYLYDFSPERLIIGKFCQFADSVQFITASANHRYDGISTFPFAVFGGGTLEGRPSLPEPGSDTRVGNDVCPAWQPPEPRRPRVLNDEGDATSNAQSCNLGSCPGALVAGLDLREQLGVAFDPLSAPWPRPGPQRPTAVDTAYGGHRVAGRLQHHPSNSAASDIMKQHFKLSTLQMSPAGPRPSSQIRTSAPWRRRRLPTGARPAKTSAKYPLAPRDESGAMECGVRR